MPKRTISITRILWKILPKLHAHCHNCHITLHTSLVCSSLSLGFSILLLSLLVFISSTYVHFQNVRSKSRKCRYSTKTIQFAFLLSLQLLRSLLIQLFCSGLKISLLPSAETTAPLLSGLGQSSEPTRTTLSITQ